MLNLFQHLLIEAEKGIPKQVRNDELIIKNKKHKQLCLCFLCHTEQRHSELVPESLDVETSST